MKRYLTVAMIINILFFINRINLKASFLSLLSQNKEKSEHFM